MAVMPTTMDVHDQPVGWTRALALDRQGMNIYVKFLLWFCVTMLPSRDRIGQIKKVLDHLVLDALEET
jgi:hypothetical protein